MLYRQLNGTITSRKSEIVGVEIGNEPLIGVVDAQGSFNLSALDLGGGDDGGGNGDCGAPLPRVTDSRAGGFDVS